MRGAAAAAMLNAEAMLAMDLLPARPAAATSHPKAGKAGVGADAKVPANA